MSVSRRTVRQFVEEFTLKDGRRLFLLAEGRLINLSAGRGASRQRQDMSFATRPSARNICIASGKLEKRVYAVPEEIDREIARLKLAAMRVSIDQLTEEQRQYLASWTHGT